MAKRLLWRAFNCHPDPDLSGEGSLDSSVAKVTSE